MFKKGIGVIVQLFDDTLCLMMLRQCAHLIAPFVSYNHFSFSSCSFIASLGSISLPNTVREALSHPSCPNAMVVEMQALNGNGTKTCCLYLLERRLLNVVGCLQYILILMGLLLD